jgi:hypothetical protein
MWAGEPDNVNRARASHAEQVRHLESAVGATRLIGILFALLGGGLLVLMVADHEPTLRLVFVAGFVVAPGVLYVVAGFFLKGRKYWAWLATLVVSVVALIGVAMLGLVVVVSFVRRERAEASIVVAFGCWVAALVGILWSLYKCLPAVREAEQVAQSGFGVVVRARAVEAIATPDTIHFGAGPLERPAPRDEPWDGTGTVKIPGDPRAQ